MRNKFGSTSTYASSQVPTEQQQTYTNHYGRKWVGKKRDFVKGPFVLASNHFRKSFSVKPCVWLRMENRISRNAFHLTVKIKALTWKSFYVSIFTSNHFRTQTRREREREKQQGEVAPITPDGIDLTGLMDCSTASIVPVSSIIA